MVLLLRPEIRVWRARGMLGVKSLSYAPAAGNPLVFKASRALWLLGSRVEDCVAGGV